MELALSIRPGDAQLNSNLAIVYQNLGQPEKAREARSRADKTK
jgi:Flp pilus assembly protein TadD